MIIVSDKPGQLGNQLWAYTNMIAIATECNSTIIFILSREYFAMFDFKVVNANKKIRIFKDGTFAAKLIRWICFYIAPKSINNSFINYVLKILRVEFIEDFIEERKFKSCYRKQRLYFIKSWPQADNKFFFIKHHIFIQTLILPEIATRTIVNKRMKRLKNQSNLVVGVHIRRGDYQFFADGKYYFEDDVYSCYMRQLQKILYPSKILFYLFSNEEIKSKNFEEFNIYCINHQSPVADLWAMSKCDYLMGPLSTFSMWASFWNNVPLYFIQDKNTVIGLVDFRPVKAHNIW